MTQEYIIKDIKILRYSIKITTTIGNKIYLEQQLVRLFKKLHDTI